jgi:hypothetical protein
MGNNFWKIVAILEVILLVVLTIYILNEKQIQEQKKFKIGNISISRETIEESFNLIGQDRIQLCNLKTNECYIIGKK